MLFSNFKAGMQSEHFVTSSLHHLLRSSQSQSDVQVRPRMASDQSQGHRDEEALQLPPFCLPASTQSHCIQVTRAVAKKFTMIISSDQVFLAKKLALFGFLSLIPAPKPTSIAITPALLRVINGSLCPHQLILHWTEECQSAQFPNSGWIRTCFSTPTPAIAGKTPIIPASAEIVLVIALLEFCGFCEFPKHNVFNSLYSSRTTDVSTC